MFFLCITSLDAMEDFERLGFESQAEQLSLITQKNKENVFENIQLEVSHRFPAPLGASFIFLPLTFLATIVSYNSECEQNERDIFYNNGFLKNWGLILLTWTRFYFTNPIVLFDLLNYTHEFIKFNKNGQKYEYQYNANMKSVNNNTCIICTKGYSKISSLNKKNKIIQFLLSGGASFGMESFVGLDDTNTIIFNDQNNNDIERIIEQNKKKEETNWEGWILHFIIEASYGENIKFGYFEYDHNHYYFLDTLKRKMYPFLYPVMHPFLPGEKILDVQSTPDKTTLIVITPIKTIKIDMTKDFDLTKEKLEKEIRLKNRKKKLLRISSKGAWWVFFLCYSQWWLHYFFKINMYQEIKPARPFLKQTISSLLLLPFYIIKNIFLEVRNINIKETGTWLNSSSQSMCVFIKETGKSIWVFLFGKSNV